MTNERTFHPRESHKLDDPDRMRWLPPAEVIKGLRLEPGCVVADIGAGTGYFTMPIARAVAPGHVHAVDLQEAMLERIETRLQQEPAANVSVQQGQASATGLAERTCDRVLLANIWHELDDRDETLEEARRLLRPQGLLGIVDWRHDAVRPPGPPLEHRVAMEELQRTLRERGWTIHEAASLGSYSYFVLASPPHDQ